MNSSSFELFDELYKDPYLDIMNKYINFGEMTELIKKRKIENIVKYNPVSTVHIKINNNVIEFNKKKFKFNNIFNAENSGDNIIFEIIEFINKRQKLKKDSTILLFALSGSGKTTLIQKIINEMEKRDKCEESIKYEITRSDFLLKEILDKYLNNTVDNTNKNINSEQIETKNDIVDDVDKKNIESEQVKTDCELLLEQIIKPTNQ